MVKPRTRLADFPLVEPAALGQHLQFSQQLGIASGLYHHDTLSRSGSTPQNAMLVAWSVNNQGVNLVALTATGQRLMSISYDGEVFSEQRSELLADKPIPGRAILAQLQLSYWPLQVLEQQLQGTDWRLTSTPALRELYYRGEKILSIHYAQAVKMLVEHKNDNNSIHKNTIIINHHIMNHHLIIHTLQRTVLNE